MPTAGGLGHSHAVRALQVLADLCMLHASIASIPSARRLMMRGAVSEARKGHSSAAIAQLGTGLRLSIAGPKVNVFPFCIAKQTLRDNGTVSESDAGQPLPVHPCHVRPRCPQLTALRHRNNRRWSWPGHLRKQSPVATLPTLTCVACIVFSSFSLHRSWASGPLPPALPMAARAAWKSFGVSAFGGMISGSPGAPFSSLGLLLFLSIFLCKGKERGYFSLGAR